MRIKPQNLEPSDPDKPEKETDDDLKKARARLSFGEEKWLYRIRVCLLIAAVFISFAVVATFFLHLVLPEQSRWLRAGEIDDIKALAVTITVGVIMSGATSYFFRRKF